MLSHPAYTPCRIWGVNEHPPSLWLAEGVKERQDALPPTQSLAKVIEKKNDQEDKEREESKGHTLRGSAAVSRNGGEANWEHSLERYWRLGQSGNFSCQLGRRSQCAAQGCLRPCSWLCGRCWSRKGQSEAGGDGLMKGLGTQVGSCSGASPPPWVSPGPFPAVPDSSIHFKWVGLNRMSAPWQQKSWQIHR